MIFFIYSLYLIAFLGAIRRVQRLPGRQSSRMSPCWKMALASAPGSFGFNSKASTAVALVVPLSIRCTTSRGFGQGPVASEKGRGYLAPLGQGEPYGLRDAAGPGYNEVNVPVHLCFR